MKLVSGGRVMRVFALLLVSEVQSVHIANTANTSTECRAKEPRAEPSSRYVDLMRKLRWSWNFARLDHLWVRVVNGRDCANSAWMKSRAPQLVRMEYVQMS